MVSFFFPTRVCCSTTRGGVKTYISCCVNYTKAFTRRCLLLPGSREDYKWSHFISWGQLQHYHDSWEENSGKLGRPCMTGLFQNDSNDRLGVCPMMLFTQVADKVYWAKVFYRGNTQNG